MGQFLGRVARAGWVAVVMWLAACGGGRAPAVSTGMDAGQWDVGRCVSIVDCGRLLPPVLPATCGNGQLDPGEECDDGNAYDGDGCTRLCQIECSSESGPCPASPGRTPACGDGIRTGAEACDDGNSAASDGCSSDCLTVEPGWLCVGSGRRCVPLCGDRVVTGPEECDDGNRLDGDGCSARCTVERLCVDGSGAQVPCADRCGDGAIEGSEWCDDGPANGDGTYGGCTADCLPGPFCGDGTLTAPEECDLGVYIGSPYAMMPGGCTFDCKKAHFCGDGQLDVAFGEQCDFGVRNGQSEDVGGATPIVRCRTDCLVTID
jgi:cysteine-rich repeat protein